MIELLNTVTLLGALQGGALAVALGKRKEDHLAAQVLAALVAGVSLMLLFGFIDRRWGWQGYPHLIGLGEPLPYLFNPLLCLYVLALTRPLERFDPRRLVHGLPFLANAAWMAQAFYLQPAATKLALAEAHLNGNGTVGMALFEVVQVVQAVGYLAVSYLALRGHARRMEGYYSDLSRIDLHWLAVIVLLNCGIWCLVAVQYGARALGWQSQVSLSPAVQVCSALFVFLIGYLFLWQPGLVQQARAARTLTDPADPADPADTGPGLGAPDAPDSMAGDAPVSAVSVVPAKSSVQHAQPSEHANRQHHAGPQERARPRYQRNRLEDGEAVELVQALQRLMRDGKPYRDGALTVQALADELAITTHLLSQVLNVHLDRTFYAFVNEHRAEALKQALSDPEQSDRGVLELALAAGFNSKSTLNSFFKKHTGMTPSQYRRRATEAP